MPLTWEDAARAVLSRGQRHFAATIADTAGGPIGYRMEDGDVIAVPGVTQQALEAALAQFPVDACDRYDDEKRVCAIKAEAQRRIRASGLGWMVEREMSGGKPVPDSIKTFAAAVRAACNQLEASDADDVTDDRHWPTIPN